MLSLRCQMKIGELHGFFMFKTISPIWNFESVKFLLPQNAVTCLFRFSPWVCTMPVYWDIGKSVWFLPLQYFQYFWFLFAFCVFIVQFQALFLNLCQSIFFSRFSSWKKTGVHGTQKCQCRYKFWIWFLYSCRMSRLFYQYSPYQSSPHFN